MCQGCQGVASQDGLGDFRQRLQKELTLREISPQQVAESWQVAYGEAGNWADFGVFFSR